MLDILIKNATIIDGTGKERYIADVSVKDGKIAGIGNIDEEAATVINAKGLCLTPGFIDSHGHSDTKIFEDPVCAYKLRQGVTTEISGNCGTTLAPVSDKNFPSYQKYMTAFNNPVTEEYKKYDTFGKYLDEVEKLKLGINLCCYVGHAAIRMAAMGYDDREPTKDEMEYMKNLVREAMESGALGMTSGLAYAPGSFSNQKEITEICSVVGEYGGIYCSHIRNSGNEVCKSVADTIEVGRKTGCKIVIAHNKVSGKENWGRSVDNIKLIHDAVDEGLDVSHDVYPYTASSTTLNISMPPSYLGMGLDVLADKIQDRDFQLELKDKIFNPVEVWGNGLRSLGYGAYLITAAPETPEAVGKTILEYAEYIGLDEFDAYVDILAKNRLRVIAITFGMSEEDVVNFLKSEYAMIGSDGVYIPGDTVTHPRGIGCFPRFLGRYVRDKKVVTLEEGIRKMTSLPAEKYFLKNKGKIEKGFDADLVLFNPDTIIDQADYRHPFLDNLGISYILVNGNIAVKDNVIVNHKAGRLIRRK